MPNVLSGTARQGKRAGKASRLSDKCVKKEAGGEKRKDKVKQREAGSRQTFPSPEESTSMDMAVESAEDAAQWGKGSS